MNVKCKLGANFCILDFWIFFSPKHHYPSDNTHFNTVEKLESLFPFLFSPQEYVPTFPDYLQNTSVLLLSSFLCISLFSTLSAFQQPDSAQQIIKEPFVKVFFFF